MPRPLTEAPLQKFVNLSSQGQSTDYGQGKGWADSRVLSPSEQYNPHSFPTPL